MEGYAYVFICVYIYVCTCAHMNADQHSSALLKDGDVMVNSVSLDASEQPVRHKLLLCCVNGV